MKRVLVVGMVLWCGFLAGRLPGQALGEEDSGLALPPPPPSRVLDDAGLFLRAPERLEKISRRLSELHRDRGWSVYLAVYSGLLGMKPEEQASALHAAWNGGSSEGLVIVYESDTRLVAFGRPLDVPAAGDGGQLAKRSGLAAFELAAALSGAMDAALSKTLPVDQVEGLVFGVADQLDAALARKTAPERSLDRLRFALIVVGGISVISLLALIGARFAGRSERHRRRIHRFPEVAVGTRLGAPFGGGRVIARRFRGNGAGPRAGSGPAASGGAG